MTLRTTLSLLALSAAMSFSGGVAAQTMIGGVEVPADQLSDVQDACTALSTQSIASPDSEDNNDTNESGADDAEDADDQEGEDDGAMSTTGGIDVSTLTIEQCREAGLVQ